jgi:hypothetical protein
VLLSFICPTDCSSTIASVVTTATRSSLSIRIWPHHVIWLSHTDFKIKSLNFDDD